MLYVTNVLLYIMYVLMYVYDYDIIHCDISEYMIYAGGVAL